MKKTLISAMTILASVVFASHAHAEMVLSQVVVDLQPGKPPREDIEVWNDGPDRMYVLAEPSEIARAGTPDEQRIALPPEGGAGLLVSPRRLVLEPGERRTIRIAAIGMRPKSERIFRVTIKPVAGALSSDQSAIKLMVGFDALVLVRPQQLVDNLVVERAGRALGLRNDGNTSQEIFAGRQCADDGTDCRDLPAKRLYPGALWQQTLPLSTQVRYKTAIGSSVRERSF